MDNNAIYSTMIRSGRTTYFVDVKQAKSGSNYLSITEHRLDQDQKKLRSTIRVFGDSIEQFKQAIDDAATSAKQ